MLGNFDLENPARNPNHNKFTVLGELAKELGFMSSRDYNARCYPETSSTVRAALIRWLTQYAEHDALELSHE